MSAKSKTRSQEKRKREKRARKDAQKALYRSYSEHGENSKSKRFMKNSKTKNTDKHKHLIGDCGNQGCLKCHPPNYRRYMSKNGVPRGMPQWMYQRWLADLKMFGL